MVQWTDDGRSCRVTQMEECVQIRQQTVADEEGTASGISDGRPNTRILIERVQDVVIATERVKCSQLRPPLTHFFSCVENETANVSSDVWNSEHVEFHHS